MKEHGGPLSVERSREESFLCRLGYVKRKATKAAHELPENFAEDNLGFYQRIKEELETWSISLAFIINWDQTGSKLAPVSELTMQREGARQVAVVGIEDKREITFLLSVVASGDMLAPQVIYRRKIEGCHAKVTFLEDWNVTHSDTH